VIGSRYFGGSKSEDDGSKIGVEGGRFVPVTRGAGSQQAEDPPEERDAAQ
jgi:hypothetical protein